MCSWILCVVAGTKKLCEYSVLFAKPGPMTDGIEAGQSSTHVLNHGILRKSKVSTGL